MTIGSDVLGSQGVASRQAWQALFGIVGDITAVESRDLNVGFEESGKSDGASGCGEFTFLASTSNTINGDFHGRSPRVSHLRGHSALPNQLVELEFFRIKLAVQLPRGGKGLTCRTDRLVGLLRVLHLARVLPGGISNIFRAI